MVLAVRACAAVVDLDVADGEVGGGGGRHGGLWHVVQSAAGGTSEVGVGCGVGVEADVFVVDGEGLHGSVFDEVAQYVVDRGAAECGHGGVQVLVDGVGRGVGAVRDEVLEDGYALLGGADVVV